MRPTTKIPTMGGGFVCANCGAKIAGPTEETCTHPQSERQRTDGIGGSFVVMCNACGKVFQKHP